MAITANSRRSSRCVVVGAHGLIGRALLAELDGTWDIHAVSHVMQSDGPGSVVWHMLDLSLPFDTSCLPTSVDAVVYLAQSGRFRDVPENVQHVFDVNTAGVVRFVDYARRADARMFVLASTGAVYPPASGRLREDAPTRALGSLDFYTATKLCSELLVGHSAAYLSVVILRYFFVYGPGQRADMLIPRLVRLIRDGGVIALAGTNGLLMNPTYVTDAGRATARALWLGESQTINVAGPEVVSLRALCSVIGAQIGHEPIFHVDSSSFAPDLVADTARMKTVLGSPDVSVSDGVRRYLEAGT